MVKLTSVSTVLCIILFFVKNEVQASERNVIINKMDYQANEAMVKMSLNLKDGPNGVRVIDLNADLIQDVPDEIYINADILKKGTVSKQYATLIKQGPTNVCDYFKNPDKDPVLKVFLDQLSNFGNLSLKCPMNKGNYYLKEFFIDGDQLPPFAPDGEYRVELEVLWMNNGAKVQIFKLIVFTTFS